MDLIKKNIFLTYGLVVLLIQVLITVLGAQYDDGSLSGLLIITSPFWGVIYWVPSELIFALNTGIAIEGHKIVSVIIGLVICLVADYSLNLIRKRRNEKQANT